MRGLLLIHYSFCRRDAVFIAIGYYKLYSISIAGTPTSPRLISGLESNVSRQERDGEREREREKEKMQKTGERITVIYELYKMNRMWKF